MKEKSHNKKSFAYRSLSEESIRLLEWDTLKTQISSFASTNMGKNAILKFEIPSEYEISKRLLQETIEINDLYGLVLPRMEELQRPNNVHFLEKGSEVLAEHITKLLIQKF